MKEYKSLPKFLLRYTILKINKLHVRLHRIISADGTPYLHNHPFNYISIILKGGYTEQLLVNDQVKEIHHTKGSFIFRHHQTYHRIKSVDEGCKTLFITWKTNKKWRLKSHQTIEVPSGYTKPVDGIHKRTIKGKEVWSKADKGIWYIGRQTKEEAQKEEKFSIYQLNEN